MSSVLRRRQSVISRHARRSPTATLEDFPGSLWEPQGRLGNSRVGAGMWYSHQQDLTLKFFMCFLCLLSLISISNYQRTDSFNVNSITIPKEKTDQNESEPMGKTEQPVSVTTFLL
ncbi:THO complex subunit 3-like protein [Cricetulus griseus]|nr:THO complex subunit 3-like protein [Cricetulus griseus]